MRKEASINLIASRTLPVLAGLCCVILAAGSAHAADSLARYVPEDTGLYVELRNADDLLIPLLEPQLWLTMADIAGQPARIEDAGDWHRRVQQTVNMTPVEAIRQLFSERVAFAGTGIGRSQDAVVLCRPESSPKELIRDWPAQQLPTSWRTSVYRLPNRVHLARQDRLLCFGDSTAQGMFTQVLDLLDADQPNTLADNSAYRRLLSRVPPRPDGVFFARLRPKTPSSAPVDPQPIAFELPGPLHGSSSVLLALHRKDSVLHFTAVGDAPATVSNPDPLVRKLIGRLPRRTLLSWSGRVDFAALLNTADSLPEDDVVRLALQVAPDDALRDLCGALDLPTCVAVGVVDANNEKSTTPPLPAVALLVRARDIETVNTAWRTLLHSTLAIYKLLSLKTGGAARNLQVETISLDKITGEKLDFTPLLAGKPGEAPLGELHLSWAMDGDVLIIASHSDWLRQIVATRHGRGPVLDPVMRKMQGSPGRQLDNIFIAQTGPIADLAKMWMHHFEKTAPAVLEQDWWRSYQPGGANPRLGIQVAADVDNRRLKIHSVTPGSPADGILKAGDEIIGCNHRRFSSDNPIQEMKRGLQRRRNARWVDLNIERDRVIIIRRIPLPFLDPVQVVQRMISIGQVVQRVLYSDGVPDAAGPRGALTLELRDDPRPLFAFTPPDSRKAEAAKKRATPPLAD